CCKSSAKGRTQSLRRYCAGATDAAGASLPTTIGSRALTANWGERCARPRRALRARHSAAVARYRQLLGIEPAKVRHDYAKFEIADPPVILSLNLGGEPGRLSHLGIRFPSTGDVASELVRVKREGVDLLQQEGATCCYAKADKFWVRDADGVPWEQ